jgi:tetraacyldisaccharide 4'-kinase
MRAPDFWSQNNGPARLAAATLLPLGWIYGAVTDWKRTHTLSYRARAKVICVGNLTAGGSGKTPIVAAIVGILKARGHHAAILSRGYGGRLRGAALVNPRMHSAADVGDEPLLLAAFAPVIVSRNRRSGAVLADTEGADVVVMDDGYQNFTLEKDLSIVVVDAEKGFGNGHVLPAGPLRESILGGLARADAVVLVGSGTPPLPGFSGPVVRARIVPCDGGRLAGRRVMAFAGIGRPEKFFDTLRALGVDLAEVREFADHHMFNAVEIAQLKAKAKDKNAMLVTTEKDFMRLAPGDREGIEFLRIEAEFESRKTIEEILSKIIPPADPSA